jgi:hypothetical protein
LNRVVVIDLGAPSSGGHGQRSNISIPIALRACGETQRQPKEHNTGRR